MAGVFTDKRDTSQRFPSSMHKNWDGKTSQFLITQPAEDTVTSFRSGRAEIGRLLTNEEVFASAREAGGGLKSKFDNGHPFSSTKRKYRCNWPDQLVLPFDTGYPAYAGVFSGRFALSKATQVNPWPVIPAADVSVMGPKAIAATYPTMPTAHLASFLGELAQDGKPTLPGSLISKSRSLRDLPRNAAGEYLNAQFGVVPYYKDLMSLANAVLESTRICEQFVRDSGRGVRRRYSFPEHKTTSVIEEGNDGGTFWTGATYFDNTYAEAYGKYPTPVVKPRSYRIERKISEQYWFSGEYSYLLESGTDFLSKIKYYEQLANKVLGTRFTVDVLWEITPWSWLADWWVDISSFTRGAAAFENDKLVLRYGYLMRHYKVDTTYTVFKPDFRFWKPASLIATYSVEQKERFRATPYGFGLNPDSFSTRQWTVLGALGLSRGPRSIR